MPIRILQDRVGLWVPGVAACFVGAGLGFFAGHPRGSFVQKTWRIENATCVVGSGTSCEIVPSALPVDRMNHEKSGVEVSEEDAEVLKNVFKFAGCDRRKVALWYYAVFASLAPSTLRCYLS